MTVTGKAAATRRPADPVRETKYEETPGYNRSVQVLFVCTANMCRSPMAAALFGRCCADPLFVRNEAVTVSSAGILSGGFESPAEVITAMAELNIDLSAHISRQISADMVARADMILGMARRHAREVVLLDASAWSRTFTLKEIVHRAERVGPRVPEEPLAHWLDRLHRGRQRTDLVGSSPDDDVPDPLGGSPDEFRATARQLAGLVERVAGLLWAPGEVPTRQA
jgi:protein-tyrosine phosphatase